MKIRIVALPVMLLLLAYSCNAQGAHGAALSWKDVGVTGATYSVFRSATSGGTKTLVKAGIAGLTYNDPLTAGQAACYTVVTSAPNMTDSVPSNEVCGTAGKDVAPSPSGLSVVFN